MNLMTSNKTKAASIHHRIWTGAIIVVTSRNDHSRRRRRRFRNPFQRQLWTFWATSTPSSSENDVSASYIRIDGPQRVATNGSTMAAIRKGNTIVVGATALVLFCVGMHDAFLGYLAMRRGITASERLHTLTWTLPWIGPTKRSLLRFGAFCPELLLSFNGENWRSLSSMFVTTSLVEWLLLVWVWTRYLPPSVFSSISVFSWQLSWPVVYLLSALTGQLWMVVYYSASVNTNSSLSTNENYDSVPALSGCAGWATAGVLCTVGIQKPSRRFPCFVSAIGLVLLHQFQTTGSVIGCSAGSFFGWAFSGIWSPSVVVSRRRWQQEQRDLIDHDYTYQDILNNGGTKEEIKVRWTLLNVFAAMVVFLLWFLPTIYLVYR